MQFPLLCEKSGAILLVLVGLTAGKQSETTLEKAIEVLRSMFAQYGLPEQLVSDNGSQFISTEFSLFFEDSQTKHTLSAPYVPSSL